MEFWREAMTTSLANFLCELHNSNNQGIFERKWRSSVLPVEDLSEREISSKTIECGTLRHNSDLAPNRVSRKEDELASCIILNHMQRLEVHLVLSWKTA